MIHAGLCSICSMALRRNILVFHQGALGDFVVTWPLALALGRVFAQSRIFYVTAGQKGALAEKALRLESSDIENGWHHLFSQEPRLPDAAAKLLDGAQQIISFISGPDDLWARNVGTLAHDVPLITLATTPPDDFAGHITDFILQQLRPFPVIEAAMSQMLRSIAARGLGLSGSTDGPVVLHPGAGSGKKCWPVEQFLELADRLRKAGRQVQVILGEVELECWPAGQIESFKRAADLKRPQTLTDLMDVLRAASRFVGNDSGPGHLAAIMGVPTVSIFGPKDAMRWRPLGPDVRLVQGEWGQVDAEAVLQAF
jgi:ADP-heptose:LPS heptosyltransferase